MLCLVTGIYKGIDDFTSGLQGPPKCGIALPSGGQITTEVLLTLSTCANFDWPATINLRMLGIVMKIRQLVQPEEN